jgi:hypothetical protein
MQHRLTETAKHLLEEARLICPPVTKEIEACRRCGGPVLEPTEKEWRTLVDWQDEELEGAVVDLSQDARRLSWCAKCGRIVPSGQHDPDWQRQFYSRDSSPEFREHLSHGRFLRALVPCPYWNWCSKKYGKVCNHCSGLGRLAFQAEPSHNPLPEKNEGSGFLKGLIAPAAKDPICFCTGLFDQYSVRCGA